MGEGCCGRARGVDVIAETCPQYLFLDQSYYEREGFEGAKWVMTPAHPTGYTLGRPS